jgi:hypothetical protein
MVAVTFSLSLRLLLLALAAVAAFGVAVGTADAATLAVTGASLSAGQLRVDGQGAAPNGSISINGTVGGSADAGGRFRVQLSPFASASCKVMVGDGTSSVQATLSGCTPVPLAKPGFDRYTTHGVVGAALAFQAHGAGSDRVAFRYDWGDGTSLRDPATGFHAVNADTGSVVGNPVTHAFGAPGSFTVTVTALDPAGGSLTSDAVALTVVALAQENDCGRGGDAGDSAAAALPITLPGTCSAAFAPDAGDVTDVYSFDVPQKARLFTLSVAPTVWPGFLCCDQITLVDPAGVTRSLTPFTFCADPRVLCDATGLPVPALPETPILEGALGYTLDMSGTWKLVVRPPFPGDAYTFSAHVGGGGDDCVQGRSPTLPLPAPLDAPNQDVAIPLLDTTEANCTGSMPFGDRDLVDSYTFPVALGEPVALSIASTAGLPPCSGRLWADVFVPSLPGHFHNFDVGCVGDRFTDASGSGTASIVLNGFWASRTDNLGYRIRVATGAHHDGDCFTGHDAADSFATATPMPASACVGDIGAADAEDWYSFEAAAGDELWTDDAPCGCAVTPTGPVQPRLPMDIFDPDGVLRQANPAANAPLVADKPGLWRVRVRTSDPFDQYEGSYGFNVVRHPLALAGLSVDPASIVGGDTSPGADVARATVTLDSTAFSKPIVAFSSGNPAVAAVPASVTVAGGFHLGFFTIATKPVAAPTTVTISATFAGVTKTATLTVTPPPTAGDTVAVTRAEYTAAQKQLRVEATSTSATATMKVFRTSTGDLIGTLTNNGGGKFSGQLSWPVDPGAITVKSSLLGSATATVVAK